MSGELLADSGMKSNAPGRSTLARGSDMGLGKHIARFSLPAVYLVIAGFHLWSLMRYPGPFVDEAWVGARAWSYLSTGRAFGALDRGVFEQFEGYWTFFPLVPTIFFSWGVRWFDNPDLLGIRLVSLGSGMLLLAGVYVIGKSIGDPRLGKLSAIFVALSLPFQYSSHLGRYDIFTATLGFSGIAVHLANRTGRVWMGLLSGLLVGIAFETHPHGAIYAPVLFALHVIDSRAETFKRSHFWAMLTGLFLGLFLYLSLHVLRYPAGFLAFNQIVYNPTHTPPLLTLKPSLMVGGILDLLRMLAYTHLITLLAVPFAIWRLARSASQPHRRLLCLIVVLALAHALLIRTKLDYYAILVSPVVDISLAFVLLRPFEKEARGRTVFFLGRASLIAGPLLSVVLNLRNVAWDLSTEFDRVQSELSQVIQPNDVVMGSQTYWFGLYEHPYFSWENLIYYQRKNKESDLEASFRAFRPDVLIVDQHWIEYISDERREEIYFESLRLSGSEFDRFLTQMDAELITTIEHDKYGPVLVYRLSWAK